MITLETGPNLWSGKRYPPNCGHLQNNKAKVHPKNIGYQNFKVKNNKNVSYIDWPFPLFYLLTYPLVELGCHGYPDYFLKKLFKYADYMWLMDALIALHFEILRINIFGLHICAIIPQVSTIMEVPLSRSQIQPHLKCKLTLETGLNLWHCISPSIACYLHCVSNKWVIEMYKPTYSSTSSGSHNWWHTWLSLLAIQTQISMSLPKTEHHLKEKPMRWVSHLQTLPGNHASW